MKHKSKNGDFIEVFSMYDERLGGTYEGRTINLVIRDEAHLGDDRKFRDQIQPTMIRTNGIIINIGNGAWKECLYTKALALGDTTEAVEIGQFKYEIENIVIRRTYDDLYEYMHGLADRGNRASADWLLGIESDLRDGGRRSLENRKNIFCEVLEEKESFVTEAEFDSCLVNDECETPPEIIGAMDIAKMIDRTVAIFGDTNYKIFDINVLKEAFERKDTLDQVDDLVAYCDRKDYSEKILGMGGDSGGMGEAVVEAMSIAMSRDIVPFKFTLQSKHKWYIELQNRILTTNRAEKLKIPKNLPHLDMLRKEMTELTVKASQNGESLMFSAPSGKEMFDDYVAATVMYVQMVGKISGLANNQTPYEKRFPSRAMQDAERLKKIITPNEKRANKLRSGFALFAGDY